MSNAQDVIARLEAAQKSVKEASEAIDDLITVHDYQDVAALIAKAAERLLEATKQLMEKNSSEALETIEVAEDYIDEMYDIIEEDLDL
jgi:ABC-type transporter Mla subunit MlaD